MAGYTGGVYREILREHGCPYCYTEMVSAKGLLHGGDESAEILSHGDEDRPLAVQIFGCEAESMAKAAEMLSQPDRGFAAVDINMGCPARKITSQGSGGALLRDVSLACDVVDAAWMGRLIGRGQIRPGDRGFRSSNDRGPREDGISGLLRESGLEDC
jgi:tRNA-dihydrouridine synthase